MSETSNLKSDFSMYLRFSLSQLTIVQASLNDDGGDDDDPKLLGAALGTTIALSFLQRAMAAQDAIERGIPLEEALRYWVNESLLDDYFLRIMKNAERE